MTRKLLVQSLVVLVFSVLTFAGSPAFAQDVLPLPKAPAATTQDTPPAQDATPERAASPSFVLLVAQPVFPVDNGGIFYYTPFQWTDVSATGYAIKVKIVETGEKFTLKPPYTCSTGKCGASALDAGLFDRTVTGQHIEWLVVTKVGTTKLKSVKFTATVIEVDAMNLLWPMDGAVTSLGGLNELKWEGGSSINLGFKVVVKDQATGKTVMSRMIARGGGKCPDGTCTLPITQDEKIMVFQEDRYYAWTVTYIGQTGEQAKVGPFRFSLTD